MHIVTVYVEGIATLFQFKFKAGTRAGAMFETLSAEVPSERWNERLLLTDDYEQRVSVHRSKVLLAQVSDINQDLDAQVVIARLSQVAQQKAQDNPIMRASGNGLFVPARQ